MSNTIKLELSAKQALIALSELISDPFLASMMGHEKYQRAMLANVKLSHALFELNKGAINVESD